jgi:hypothetical protein
MMAKYVFLVMTNPTSPEQEAEYNRWYGTDHYRDVLGVPGFVAAQRFRLAPVQYDKSGPDRSQEAGDVGKHPYKYLSLYEIETDDLASVFKEVKKREAETWVISDTLDLSDFSTSIFEVIGDKVTAQRR